MLACKIDVDAFGEVRYLSGYHVSRLVGHVIFATVLTTESRLIFHHFTTAVVWKAGGIENSIVILNTAHVTIQEEEVVLVSIIFPRKTVINFTDEV
mgnify:CR=1 FL=1